MGQRGRVLGPLAARHALGPSGSPRRVEDQTSQAVVGRLAFRERRLVKVSVEQRVEGHGVAGGDVDRDEARLDAPLGATGQDGGRGVPLVHHHARRRVADAVGDLATGQPEVQWGSDRAEPLAGQVERRQLLPVAQAEDHAVARPHPQSAQAAGRALHASVPVGVAVAPLPIDDRRRPRSTLGGEIEQRVETHRITSRAAPPGQERAALPTADRPGPRAWRR